MYAVFFVFSIVNNSCFRLAIRDKFIRDSAKGGKFDLYHKGA